MSTETIENTSVADTSVAGASVADTIVAGTSVADTIVAGTSVAGTSVAGTSVLASPSDIFVSIIDEQKKKEDDADIWKNSIYKKICNLESNNVGNVGEIFLQKVCENQHIKSSIDGTKTKQKGMEIKGTGDGKINERTVEIKLARLGANQTSFQHELGEHPWLAEFMTFLDVTPTFIYLTIFPNFDETHYKSGFKCEPYFPSKKVTWRKGEGAFKLDTSPTINEKLIIKGNCMKIAECTTYEEIGVFINSIIKFNRTLVCSLPKVL
jgi:hypothetical protein